MVVDGPFDVFRMIGVDNVHLHKFALSQDVMELFVLAGRDIS